MIRPRREQFFLENNLIRRRCSKRHSIVRKRRRAIGSISRAWVSTSRARVLPLCFSRFFHFSHPRPLPFLDVAALVHFVLVPSPVSWREERVRVPSCTSPLRGEFPFLTFRSISSPAR